MTRKQLEELGYSEEQVKELMDLNGKAIEKIKTERDEAIAKVTAAEEELAKRDKDFKELQSNAKVDEELQTKFNELNEQYTQYQEDAKVREQQIKLDSAVAIALATSGTVDEVSLKANLDLENVELLEDGTLKGLNEQITTLKESKSFLFGETLDGGLKHTNPPKKETPDDILRKAMDL